MVQCGVVQCGVVQCGAVWCSVVWCDVVSCALCNLLYLTEDGIETPRHPISSHPIPSHSISTLQLTIPSHPIPHAIPPPYLIPSGRRGVALEVSMRYGDFLNPLGGVGNAHPNNGFGATSISVLEGFDDQSMGRSFSRVICCLS